MTHEEILELLRGCLLPDWEKLPDFGLYKDQLIVYISRELPGLTGKLDLTSSMINNYVKAGLIEKPNGKKYSREALAQLLMIILLKMTTPMDLVKTLIRPEDGTETQELYGTFRRYQEQVIKEYSGQEDSPRLKVALQSSFFQYITRVSG